MNRTASLAMLFASVMFAQPDSTRGGVSETVRSARGNIFNFLTTSAAVPLEQTNPQAPPPVSIVTTRPLPEMPVDLSDTIVIGTVTSSKAFLSNDRKLIYTEYGISLSQVLKQPNMVKPSGSLTVVQLGGEVILPNGRKLSHAVRGLGLTLQAGERYLLFMKYNQDADCFTVVKYWGLRSGSLVPQAEDDQLRSSTKTSAVAGRQEDLVIAELRELLK